MVLQYQHFNFLGVLMFEVLLMVLTFFSSSKIKLFFIDLVQNQTSQPKLPVPSEEQVTYPWIGDPTCKNFPVQVK
jgi:hypothetical protein